MTPFDWYLIAGGAGAIALVSIPPLYRWWKDGKAKDAAPSPSRSVACSPSQFPDDVRAYDNARHLKYWRNRVEFFKAALATELRMKRGRIGLARINLANAVAQVLRLEKDDPATKLAMQTAAVTSCPSDPA